MSFQIGTDQRPLRVAVVGSGPSGFYAAEALFKSPAVIKVDMFDRLPSPHGLVRYGVAPDHAKIKNVTRVYDRTAENPQFSFLGNVMVGRDIGVEEVKQFYDAIIFACGAETDRKLGIPGEDIQGSHTATEFVAWYNGHPDYLHHKFNLSAEAAVIAGQGNVAMDVCRILCKTVDELKTTDIAQHALNALAQSKIKEVHMVGRRGPAQAAFTPVEIREFGELTDCDVIIDPKDLELSQASQKELSDPQRKKNYDIMKKLAMEGKKGKSKKFFIHFLKSPVELAGGDKLNKVVLEKNELVGETGKQKAKGTGQKEALSCGIFFRSVGYRGIPVPGVPFQGDWGIIPNEKGRVADGGHPVPGLYAAGWIKRGPSGIIGTNKPDSEETVGCLLEDLPELTPCPVPSTEKLLDLLKEKHIRVVSFADWKKIDAAEVARGQKAGKPREKFVALQEMLAVLQ